MPPSSAAAPGNGEPPDPEGASIGSPEFPRTLPSAGVERSGRPREVESTRQHIRLALENWEKQYADVLRYERAKVEDDANKAAVRRALARSGASLALALSALIPVATNASDLQEIGDGATTVGNGLILLGGISLATCAASAWWAGYLLLLRAKFRKARTRPLLPPERLDARVIVAIIESTADVPYYRERDIDPDLGFGWKPGVAPAPTPQDDPGS